MLLFNLYCFCFKIVELNINFIFSEEYIVFINEVGCIIVFYNCHKNIKHKCIV